MHMRGTLKKTDGFGLSRGRIRWRLIISVCLNGKAPKRGTRKNTHGITKTDTKPLKREPDRREYKGSQDRPKGQRVPIPLPGLLVPNEKVSCLSYPVDPAGGHTLVPRTKPCICAAHFSRQIGFGLSREGLCGRLIIAIALT